MSHQKGKTPVIIGFVLFIISFVTLFCNEQNYVNSIKKANFAEQNAIELKSNYISPANDGKLVQLANSVYSNQILADGILTIPKAIALIRTTEMYQWEEYTTNNDGYQYRKNWNSFLINSDNFEKIEHKNPKKFKYEPKNIYAKNIGFGKFYLSENIVKKINQINKIQNLPYNSNFKTYNGFYFTGKDFDNPQIGDQKLFYSYIPSGIKLSIIAKQSGNHLEPMPSKVGDIAIVSNGTKNLTEMLKEYRNANSSNTWGIRGIGLILMFIGLNLIIQPIVNFTGKIPILGEITQFAALFTTIIISIALTAITISLGWLTYRPEISIPIIIIAIITIILQKRKKKIVIE